MQSVSRAPTRYWAMPACAVWVVVFGATAATSVERPVCTPGIPGPVRNPSVVAFMATPARDTLLAGPGAIQFEIDSSGPAPRDPRRGIFGQVIRIGRIERHAPAILREAVAAGHTIGVAVPWDLGPGCETFPASGTARWLPVGRPHLLFLTLRDRAHWVGGRPTFDAEPLGTSAYHGGTVIVRGGRQPPARPALAPADYLSLYEVLPTWEELRASPDSAAAPVFRWAAAHPDLARTSDAESMLEMLHYEVASVRYTTRPSPIAGTYRVVVRAANGDSAIFFVRTALRPDHTFVTDPVTAVDSSSPESRLGVAYYLTGRAGRTIDALPVPPTTTEDERALIGGFSVLVTPIASSADSTIVAADTYLLDAAVRLAPDDRTRTALSAAVAAHSSPTTMAGRFVLTRDGRAYFTLRIERHGALVATVRADRISNDHLIDGSERR